MNYYDALRLAVGSVLVSRDTPERPPLVVAAVMRDEVKKQCLVRVKEGVHLRTFSAEDLERPPEFGRWDPDACAWFDRRTGEQLLPKPSAEGAA